MTNSSDTSTPTRDETPCGLSELPAWMCGCRIHAKRSARADRALADKLRSDTAFDGHDRTIPREGDPKHTGTPGPWFTASYPGTCSSELCGLPFTVGDTIRFDGQGGYECQEYTE